MGKKKSSHGRETVSKGSGIQIICVVQQANQEEMEGVGSVSVRIVEINGEVFMKAVNEQIV